VTVSPQLFVAYATPGEEADYKLIIPVINWDNTCRIEVRDATNSILTLTFNSNHEAELQRKDPIGEYPFVISLYTTREGDADVLVSQQNVTVSVLDRSAGTDPNVAEEACRQVVEVIKQVNVESGAGMGGAWIQAKNMPAAWRKLHQQFDGKEVGVLCGILEQAHDFKIHWVALNFLNLSAQEVTDPTLLSRILSVAGDQIPNGGHVQTIALQLVQSLEAPKEAIWKVLLSAVRVAPPQVAWPIIKHLVLVIPEDGVKATGNAILRVIKSMNADSYEIGYCLSALEDIDYREGAGSLRDIMIRAGNPQASAKIAALLAKWNDSEAAAAIRRHLEMSHATATTLYILDAMQALYRIEGESCLHFIGQILAKCPPFVQENIGGDHLGELKFHPVIVEVIREIAAKTNHPGVKKSLTQFLEKK
jgi:hypothetical protein